jgi:glycosyltransferase involved in cell wall biosynthesis
MTFNSNAPTNPTPVLHLITRLIVGGAQENTMLTAAMLDQEHFRVEALSGPQTGSEGSLIEEVRQRGVQLTILPEMVREISPKNDLLALWKLFRLMRRKRYTIVHTHSSKAGIIGRLAARLAGTPLIVHTVHGWSFHEHMSPSVRKTYILLERISAAYTSAMIVVTNKDIDKGLKEGIGKPEQYRLIRSAVPLDEFDPGNEDRNTVRRELGIPTEAFVMGNLGRFSAQKNPLDWVRVAGEVGRKYPEVHFLLVGDGPMRAEVEAALASERISDRTVLTGLRRDAAHMLAAMDVFVLTSLWEGLPRVIPQAMLMGLPIVANRADGTVEAITDGENGFLCDPGDIKQMSMRVSYLIGNAEIRSTMGQVGQEFARREFDLTKMIKQIEALYGELLVNQGF